MLRRATISVLALALGACGGAKEPAKAPAPKQADGTKGDTADPAAPPNDAKAPPPKAEPVAAKGPLPPVPFEDKSGIAPAPDLKQAEFDAKHPDGSFSIAGLRARLDENVRAGDARTEVQVTAYVQDIYVPPTCPEGEVCAPHKQPHLWMVDSPDIKGKRRALMVVGYTFTIPEWEAETWKDQPEVVLEVGKQYTMKGLFKRFSDTGFAHDRGLFEFRAYRPEPKGDWVFPPGAPWHPVAVAEMEAQNAALMERAKAEAAKRK